MRATYGKLPVAGIPRITRPRRRKNTGHLSGFSIVDPGGNWIRFTQAAGAADVPDREPDHDDAAPSRLAEALRNAAVLGDSHGDHRQAAKILARALRQAGDATGGHATGGHATGGHATGGHATAGGATGGERFEALVYLAELARRRSDDDQARVRLAEARGTELADAERDRLAEVLAAADELERDLARPATTKG
ncbi:hypothetical protein ACIBF5_13000 [Micromonospora sp. NPDC050417]|uniref:hypothetical protein n=1 Tax=Micromonospora sp. NPDC050417 TaxID=3364280 RepID=UPI00379C622E